MIISSKQGFRTFENQQIELRLGFTGNLRGGVVMIEQRKLAENGAVGRFQRNAKLRQSGFV